MKKASFRIVAMLALFCLAAAISYAQQPTILVSQYTASCPATGSSNTGSDWVFWWASTQYSQTALVVFDSPNFTWTVIDMSGPTLSPLQPAPIATHSGHYYAFTVVGNLPSGTKKGDVWYSFPGGAISYGGATLSCT